MTATSHEGHGESGTVRHTIVVEGGPAFLSNCASALFRAAAYFPEDGPAHECLSRLARATAAATEATT
jgi:hypothetical protein